MRSLQLSLEECLASERDLADSVDLQTFSSLQLCSFDVENGRHKLMSAVRLKFWTQFWSSFETHWTRLLGPVLGSISGSIFGPHFRSPILGPSFGFIFGTQFFVNFWLQFLSIFEDSKNFHIRDLYMIFPMKKSGAKSVMKIRIKNPHQF